MRWLNRSLATVGLGLALMLSARGEDAVKPESKASPELKAAIEKLKLPGLKINLDEWSVDVDAKVCLKDGFLELIACTKDSKEHESIIMVEAKPSHIHTALLLLGAKPGNPAMRKAIGEGENMRFIDLPPRGGPIGVYLLTDEKTKERPISDFIKAAGQEQGYEAPAEGKEGKFPTHEFLFAGSVLFGGENGQPKQYAADQSGDVISISTFGDELLCLPGIHGQENGSLTWMVDGEKLPELGAKVILRLRPVESAVGPEKK